MRRAAAEVCGKMCLTPPSMTALPVGNMEYIHLRTGGFMVPHCLASVLLSAHFRDSSPQARSFISPFGNLKTIFTCYHSLLFYCALSDGILQRSAISLRGCGHCPASLTDVSYLEVVPYQWGGGISNPVSLLWFLSLRVGPSGYSGNLHFSPCLSRQHIYVNALRIDALKEWWMALCHRPVIVLIYERRPFH